MGLAGEPEQNLWKEMSCRQNLENQRLRITELNLQINKTYYLPLWGKSRSEVKENRGQLPVASASGAVFHRSSKYGESSARAALEWAVR